ncbi:MAG: hypothetical protein AMXMBFR7_00580 [Planctomycetota bacterium]
MMPGMRTSSFPGRVEDALLDLELSAPASLGAARVLLRPAPGYGGRWYGLYANARLAAVVYAAEGGAAEALLAWPAEAEELCVHAEDLGGWPAGYDPEFTARAADEMSAPGLRLEWAAQPEALWGSEDGGQLSGWLISGAKRFSNSDPLAGWPTRASWAVALDDEDGVRRVRLYASGRLVAEGSRAGDGAVELEARNESGLSGSVTVAYEGGVALGEAKLIARWPAAYALHFAPGGLSFPRAAEAEVFDDGRSGRYRFASGKLAAGIYTVAVRPISDTGAAAGEPETRTVEVYGPPQAPGAAAYASGDAASTTVAWVPSATAGATYRVYAGEIGGALRMLEPQSVAGPPYEAALPAVSGYPGLRRVLVRAVKDGVEESNGQVLTLEYAADGRVVASRPNAARIAEVAVEEGMTVRVRAVYRASGERAAPETAELYLAEGEAAFDFEAPAASEPWDAELAGVRGAELAAVASGAGWYRVAVRARSADGTPDAGEAWERVYVSASEPAGVGEWEAWAGR